MRGADRGQAYTLEGIIAAIILASAVLYGLQAVDVAPYTSEERDDRRIAELRTQVSDALAVAEDEGALRQAVTCIDPSTGDPHPRLGHRPHIDPTFTNATALGAILNGTLDEGNRQYRVLFDYWHPASGEVESVLVYPEGGSTQVSFTREPVTATSRVIVYDSTPVRGPNCDPVGGNDPTMAEWYRNASRPIYLPEAHASTPDREPYAVVTVRVVAW